MSGIPDSLIAAILYAAGRKLWIKLNDPVANAIDKTITYFSQKENGFEIKREHFAAILEGTIGEEEIEKFRSGEKFIDGDKLALQFAIFGEFYLEDESKTLEIATEVFSYFKHALINELLKDPKSSFETLYSIQSIFHIISQQERQTILNAIEDLKKNISEVEKTEVKALWPGVSLPAAGPRVVVPFAGRVEELKELTKAMKGERKIVAIVGAGHKKELLDLIIMKIS